MSYVNKTCGLLRCTMAKAAALPFTSEKDYGYILVYTAQPDCVLELEDKAYPLARRTVLLIDLSVPFTLKGEKGYAYILSLKSANNLPPHLDIQDMLVRYPATSLLWEAARPCVRFVDCDQIHLMLIHLFKELSSKRQNNDMVICLMLQALFLKCLRNRIEHNSKPGVRLLAEACAYCFEHFREDINAPIIASHIGISRSYLESLFAKHKGHSIANYINHLRVDDAAFMLTTTKRSVSDVAAYCGFHSRQNFTRVFSAQIGFSPREYRMLFFVDLDFSYEE